MVEFMDIPRKGDRAVVICTMYTEKSDLLCVKVVETCLVPWSNKSLMKHTGKVVATNFIDRKKQELEGESEREGRWKGKRQRDPFSTVNSLVRCY